MYVCVCNSLTGRELLKASQESGETEPERLYELLGRVPMCGRCITFVREYISAARLDPELKAIEFARRRSDLLDGDMVEIVDNRA